MSSANLIICDRCGKETSRHELFVLATVEGGPDPATWAHVWAAQVSPYAWLPGRGPHTDACPGCLTDDEREQLGEAVATIKEAREASYWDSPWVLDADSASARAVRAFSDAVEEVDRYLGDWPEAHAGELRGRVIAVRDQADALRVEHEGPPAP